MEAIGGQAGSAMRACNLAGEARTDGAVDVAHGVFQALRRTGEDAGQGVLHHLFRQFTLVEGRVGGLDTVARFALGDAALGEQDIEFEPTLPV